MRQPVFLFERVICLTVRVFRLARLLRRLKKRRRYTTIKQQPDYFFKDYFQIYWQTQILKIVSAIFNVFPSGLAIYR